MDLYGWDYTGRNIGSELHRQFRIMVDYLQNSSFVNHRFWGGELQSELAVKMGTSAGQVRTVKKMCENFGFINPTAFDGKTEPTKGNILTASGGIVYSAASLENTIISDDNLAQSNKDQAVKEIKKMYEEAYCDALKAYYFTNSDGSCFSPLRATLQALEKYSKLDKWEWYLLNTLISKDDDSSQKARLDYYILQYRSGYLKFSMDDVKGKKKGHQYFPQQLDFAGLAQVVQRPEWFIYKSSIHNDIKSEVMAPEFTKTLYHI